VHASIEALQESPRLLEHERERLLSDRLEQLEDLTALTNDVTELEQLALREPVWSDDPSP
jgi:hypothetical protein